MKSVQATKPPIIIVTDNASKPASWFQPSKSAFTLCSVALDGFASGTLTMIQLSLCLIVCLFNPLPLPFPPSPGAKSPCSFASRHRIASAMPTLWSLPLGQATKTRASGSEVSRGTRKGRSSGSSCRSCLLPTFPRLRGRCRCFVPVSVLASVGSGVGEAVITAAKSAEVAERAAASRVPRYTCLVGSINAHRGTLTLLASCVRDEIRDGRLSSEVRRSSSLCVQKTGAVRP